MPDHHDDIRAGAERTLQDAYLLPLAEIVDSEKTVQAPPATTSWLIPDRDRAVLDLWGLPARIKAGFFENTPQQALDPALSRYGSGFYLLGRLNHLCIGAEIGTGAVYVLSEEPASSNSLLNSSIEHYVECSWRWCAALPVLIQLVDWAWEPDQLDFYDERRAEVGRNIAAIDPEAASGKGALWQELTDV
ncbi:SUKH-4 family immunity protein [Nocardiopsis sp. CNT-189]|uniref:SUKH-4 family immunity protein n=1 Tax=Nocardiopsis oceanisediminis TaxID=2816862 RepID=UPI003B39624A